MSDPDPQAIIEAELRARRDSLPPSLARATWQLMLGEVDASLDTLRVVHEQQPVSRETALPTVALLVGDPDAAARHASMAVERPSADWVPGWRQYQTTVLAIIAANESLATASLAELEEYGSTHQRLPSGPPSGVAAIPAGILAADVDQASAGLSVWLGWHLRSARSRSVRFNNASGVICLEAIVALLVAHARGLTLRVDPAFRQASVPVLAVRITHWEGRPLDRVAEGSLETDLVAGPWLAARGLDIGPPPVAASRPRATPKRPRPPAARPSEVEASVVVDFLRRRVSEGRASRWQLISWALMIGDVLAARRHLQLALADAHQAWEASRPQQGGILRRFLRSEGLPNSNLVREHFGLALAAGDDSGLDESGRALRAWMDAVQEDERRQSRPIHPAYEHVAGYLDYLADLFGPSRPRAPAERVSTLPRNLHAACVGLESRGTALVEQALNTTLEEHARSLERATSPPAALSLPAIQIAAATRRLGMHVATEPKFATHPVPIEVRDTPGPRGPIGRVATDLLGRDLFPV
jgi:hypothetical protein